MLALRHLRFAAFAAAAFAFAFASAPTSLGQEKKTEEKKGEEKKTDEKKGDAKKVKSKLKITVPQDDAELKIEGKDTKPTGPIREFETPEIDAGKLFEYSFSVTWKPNNYTTLTRTKAIEFKAGEDINVDLTKVDPKVPDKAVVRWVPTPDDIVDEMIKMAKVTKDDVVYEPGAGDAKILIAAAKAGAKKGVGIEIDAKKAAEATQKVKDAKLDNVITIIEGDALKDRDYSEATVVFLYMGNEFNNLLRPILEKQLKPGSRIVSHRFVLGDWKPDETKKVTGKDGDEYLLHIWTVKKPK